MALYWLMLRLVPTRVRRFLGEALGPGSHDRFGRIVSRLSTKEQRLWFAVPSSCYGKRQYPSNLGITLTTRCNLRCFFCRPEWFPSGDLEFENIFKLEKAIKHAKVIQLSSGGEPLLYPKFEDVLGYIYSMNPREDLVHIVTNGTRLSRHVASLVRGHLGSLVISLNAATEETYNRDMKYGNFSETVSAVRAFMSELDECDGRKVVLSFVAHAGNFREMPGFVSLACDLGMSSVGVLPYHVVRAEDSRLSLLNVREEYNATVDRALDAGAKLGVKFSAGKFAYAEEFDFRACLKPFNECWIMGNGDVLVCCFSDGFSMGNAYRSTFEEVWFGEAYRRLRSGRWLPACHRCLAYRSFDDYANHIHPMISGSTESEPIRRHYDTLQGDAGKR